MLSSPTCKQEPPACPPLVFPWCTRDTSECVAPGSQSLRVEILVSSSGLCRVVFGIVFKKEECATSVISLVSRTQKKESHILPFLMNVLCVCVFLLKTKLELGILSVACAVWSFGSL